MDKGTVIWGYIRRDKECRKLFELLPEKEIEKVVIKNYKRNEYIIENSRYLEHVYIILDGISAIVKKNRITEKPVILNRMGYLDIVGIYEYAWDIRRVGSVIARTDCTVAEIYKKDIEMWIHEYPQFVLGMYTRIMDRNFKHVDYLNYYIKCTTECAVISFLIEQYQLNMRGRMEEGGMIRILETRAEISEEIGRDIRSVNRVVSKLKDEKYIQLRRGKIYISSEMIPKLIQLRDSLID